MATADEFIPQPFTADFLNPDQFRSQLADRARQAAADEAAFQSMRNSSGTPARSTIVAAGRIAANAPMQQNNPAVRSQPLPPSAPASSSSSSMAPATQTARVPRSVKARGAKAQNRLGEFDRLRDGVQKQLDHELRGLNDVVSQGGSPDPLAFKRAQERFQNGMREIDAQERNAKTDITAVGLRGELETERAEKRKASAQRNAQRAQTTQTTADVKALVGQTTQGKLSALGTPTDTGTRPITPYNVGALPAQDQKVAAAVSNLAQPAAPTPPAPTPPTTTPVAPDPYANVHPPWTGPKYMPTPQVIPPGMGQSYNEGQSIGPARQGNPGGISGHPRFNQMGPPAPRPQAPRPPLPSPMDGRITREPIPELNFPLTSFSNTPQQQTNKGPTYFDQNAQDIGVDPTVRPRDPRPIPTYFDQNAQDISADPRAQPMNQGPTYFDQNAENIGADPTVRPRDPRAPLPSPMDQRRPYEAQPELTYPLTSFSNSPPQPPQPPQPPLTIDPAVRQQLVAAYQNPGSAFGQLLREAGSANNNKFLLELQTKSPAEQQQILQQYETQAEEAAGRNYKLNGLLQNERYRQGSEESQAYSESVKSDAQRNAEAITNDEYNRQFNRANWREVTNPELENKFQADVFRRMQRDTPSDPLLQMAQGVAPPDPSRMYQQGFNNLNASIPGVNLGTQVQSGLEGALFTPPARMANLINSSGQAIMDPTALNLASLLLPQATRYVKPLRFANDAVGDASRGYKASKLPAKLKGRA